jgi:hypothetical protein
MSKVEATFVGHRAEVVIRIAVILSILLSLFASIRVYNLIDCQRKYTVANAVALQARDNASRVDQEATDKMVLAVSTATNSTQVSAALQEFLKTRRQAEEERARNPYPLPQNFC